LQGVQRISSLPLGAARQHAMQRVSDEGKAAAASTRNTTRPAGRFSVAITQRPRPARSSILTGNAFSRATSIDVALKQRPVGLHRRRATGAAAPATADAPTSRRATRKKSSAV